MFHIKICGVTSVEDARMIAEAGADAIGLNFYPGSKRYIDPVTAKLIAASLPWMVLRVGVFVNAPIDDIRRTAAAVGLDLGAVARRRTARVCSAVRSGIRAPRSCGRFSSRSRHPARRRLPASVCPAGLPVGHDPRRGPRAG